MPVRTRPVELGDLIDPLTAMEIYAPRSEVQPMPQKEYTGTVYGGSFGAGQREAPHIQMMSALGNWGAGLFEEEEEGWEERRSELLKNLSSDYYPIVSDLMRTDSTNEWYNLLTRFDIKRNDQRYMADQGIGGFAGYMAGAMLDPVIAGTSIAAAGVELATAARAGYGYNAAKIGGLAMAEATVAEGILQAVDPLRTAPESFFTIFASGVFGSFMGVAGEGFSRVLGGRKVDALREEIDKQLGGMFAEARNSVRSVQDLKPIGYGEYNPLIYSDMADVRLPVEAQNAITDFVGHAPMAVERGPSMGIMLPDKLEDAFSATPSKKGKKIRSQIEDSFEPIKARLKEQGETIRLYRFEQTGKDAKKRNVLSWSSDLRFVKEHAGLYPKGKIFSESDIVRMEKELDVTGRVQINEDTYLETIPAKGKIPEHIGIYSERSGGFVTDTESVRHFLSSRNKDELDVRQRNLDKSESIYMADIPVEDVVWITNRAGQSEFIVKNTRPAGKELEERLAEMEAELDAPAYAPPTDEASTVGSASAMTDPTVKSERPHYTPTKHYSDYMMQSPVTRLLNNDTAGWASRYVDVMVPHNFLKDSHYDGTNALAGMDTATVHEEVQFAIADIFRTLTDASKNASRSLKKRGVNMSEQDVAIAAGQAARREENPIEFAKFEDEVQEVALHFRRFYDEWGEREVAQDLLTPEARAENAKNYPRMYDLQTMLNKWDNWEKVMGKYFITRGLDLDVEDIQYAAKSIYDTMSGTRIGNKYPSEVVFKESKKLKKAEQNIKVKKGKAKVKGRVPARLKGRTIKMKDIDGLEDFLIDDIRIVGKRYVKNVAPHVIHREIWGKDNLMPTGKEGIPLPKVAVEQIKTKYAGKRSRAKGPSAREKIDKQENAVFNDMQYITGEILSMNQPSAAGLRGITTDFANSEPVKKIGGHVKGYTGASALGYLVPMAMNDIAIPVLYNGLLRQFKVMPSLVLPKVANNTIKRGLRTANIGLDRMDAHRMAGVADMEEWGYNPTVWENPSSTLKQKAKYAISGQNVANMAFQLFPANIWNSVMKTNSAMMDQDRILSHVLRWDTLGETTKAMERRLGINDEMAAMFRENYNRQPKKTQLGARFADTESWDVEARVTFQKLIFGESEMQVVMPLKWERPISVNNALMSVPMQFKGWMQSNTIRHLSSAGQRLLKADVKVLEFVTTAITIALMTDVFNAWSKNGWDSDKTMDEWNNMPWAERLMRAVERSSLANIGLDVMMGMDNFAKGQLAPLLGMSEQRLYPKQGLGLESRVPGLGYLGRVADTLSAAGQQMLGLEEFTAKDLHKLRSLFPLQNVFYLKWLFDQLEEGTAEGLELPAGGRKQSTPAYGT